VRQAAERLAATGARVETRVLVGRPPQAIAREARDAAATLIVMGARGLGPLASTFLGSVSAEVVDAAPCPVLVSRSEDVRRILFATDGSEGSRAAERHLATLLLAQRAPVTVVSVAEVFHAWSIGIAPTMVSRVLEIQAEDEARARTVHEGIATGTAERLVAEGVDARPLVRIGDPALQILATAADVRADLIVLGSRGQTGLRRLLLGSVARAVLTRATASVLIVRDGETPPDA
jgi:nucleotide-binding universal stress UspA family protein